MKPRNTFLQINLPYGLEKNIEGKWRTFNRKYQTLLLEGVNARSTTEDKGFIFYRGLTDKFILSLGGTDNLAVKRNENGEIIEFWLWGDGTHPINSERPGAWENYICKIKKLSSLQYKII